MKKYFVLSFILFSTTLSFSQQTVGRLDFNFIGYISISKDSSNQYFIPPNYPDISKIFDFPINTTEKVPQWKYKNKNQILKQMQFVDSNTVLITLQNGEIVKGAFWEFSKQPSRIEYDENIGLMSYNLKYINEKREAFSYNIISLDQQKGYFLQQLETADIDSNYYALYMIDISNIELPKVSNEELKYKDLRSLL